MKVTINLRSGIGPLVLELDGDEDAVLARIKSAIDRQEILDLTDTKGDRVVIPSSAIGYILVPAATSHRVGFGRL